MFRCGHIAWMAVGLSLAVFAAPAPSRAQTGGLTGSVKDEKGNTLVGYQVLIERQEIKGNYHTKTDKKGNYVYVGLPIGNYKISLVDPNGRTVFFFNNKHVGLGDPTEVDFDLAKERATAQKEQQANPEYQKRLEDQSKEQKQMTGLKQLYDQANALFEQKKYAEAAAAFEQAMPMAKDKNLAIVTARAAESYDKARQFDKALEYYQKAVATNPTDANLHNGLGNVYAEMNKIPEAQAEFQKSAELNPSGARSAYFNLGAIMYNVGKMDEAAAAFKKSTEVDPNFADAYYWRSLALMGKATLTADGRIVAPPGTAEALETYLKLEPNGKNAASAQQMLQTIQGQVQTEIKVERKKKRG